MSINQKIWKITNGVEEVVAQKLDNEKELEEILQNKISILSNDWLVIGRQISVGAGIIDLLAVDEYGSIIVIELKKGKTPRDVIAQVLDYASCVKNFTASKIISIYDEFKDKFLKTGESFDNYFRKKFDTDFDEENLNANNNPEIVVVSAELDSSSERIVKYLHELKIPINILFFKIFNIGGEKCISRAWFFDPQETAGIAAEKGDGTEWNGEYYFVFGDGESRSWQDAQQYGFVSAGGGRWYTNSMSKLHVKDRIWVHIPKRGYAGVGIVKEVSTRADEVLFDVDGEKNIYTLSDKAKYHEENIGDDDNSEYLVKVEWQKTVDISKCVWEKGFFANQNTVCAPKTKAWERTVGRLKEIWKIDD